VGIIHSTFHTLRNNLNRKLLAQGDSKLLSGFPWPIIFKPEKQNKTAYGI